MVRIIKPIKYSKVISAVTIILLFLFSYPFVKNSFAQTCTGTNISIAVGQTCGNGLDVVDNNVSIVNAGTVTSPGTVTGPGNIDRVVNGIYFEFATGGSIVNTGTITSGSNPDIIKAISLHGSTLNSVTNSGII